MIFVTIGTTQPFDALIREVDRLVAEGEVREEVFAQIGNGSYVPTHCEWDRYVDGIWDKYQQARLIITHGGVGSVYELLMSERPFIVVPNPLLEGDHQTDLVQALERQGQCVCCYRIEDLGDAIRQYGGPVTFKRDGRLPAAIWDFAARGPVAPTGEEGDDG